MYEYNTTAVINVTFTCLLRVVDDEVPFCSIQVGECTVCMCVHFIVNTVTSAPRCNTSLQGAVASQYFLHMPFVSCIQLFLFHYVLKVMYLPWLCLCVVMYLAVCNFSDSIWNLSLFLMYIFPLCLRLVRRDSLFMY
jgi:hypothetical protein